MQSSNKRAYFWKTIKPDNFFLLFLIIGVSQWFFHVYNPLLILFCVPSLLSLKNRMPSKIRSTVFWLLLFSLIYTVSASIRGLIGTRLLYLYYFFPAAFYVIGYRLSLRYRNNETVLVTVLLIIMLSFASYYIYFVYSSFSNEHDIIFQTRNVYDETGGGLLSATALGLGCAPIIAGLGFLFIPGEDRLSNIVRIIGLVSGIFATYTMTRVVTRSSMVVAAVVFLFSFYLYIKNIRKEHNATLFIATALIFIFVITYYFVKSGLFNLIVDAYSERNEVNLGTGGDRYGRWLDAPLDIIHYPFGTPSGKMTSGLKSWAHNLWLDIGLVSGIVPFLIMSIIMLRNLVLTFRLVKGNRCGYFLKVYICCLVISFFLSSFVEPVVESVLMHFYLYIMICGVVEGLLKNN